MSTALQGEAGFCETADVQQALQETELSMGEGPLATANVEAAIRGASAWFGERSGGYFYDSTAASGDLLDSSPATAENLILDVPSSPHRQDGQLFRPAERTRTHREYPNTTAGQYVKVPLPRLSVQSIDRLAVRQPGGDTEDWVAAPDMVEGRGEDYYLQIDGDGGYGRSYLYLHAGSIGPRQSFDELLTVDVTFGQDWDSEPWGNVRRGIAALAAAQLVVDDDVLTSIPDEGQLIGVDTQAQQLLNQAFGFGRGDDSEGGMGGYLSPYLEVPVE